MDKFKPKDTDIIGEMKDQFSSFIKKSQVLTEQQKQALQEELGHNRFDNRFNYKPFIEEAVGLAVGEWKRQQFNLAELWQKVAVQNSIISNDPHKTANKVIASFKQEFDCED